MIMYVQLQINLEELAVAYFTAYYLMTKGKQNSQSGTPFGTLIRYIK